MEVDPTNGRAMSGESWAAIIGVATYAAFKLIDRLLPPGRHFKFIDRFLTEDTPKETDDES